ncbi:shikimate dehydrogenase [Wenzhouxiangella sp. XN201]|uniref:shikimate dehydrogenase n=1 Tax=Wenzhouxiangella sp. XN201 TaxID=2710755 RepID=UPI0013CDDE55|nr:shikimate dehydrogenase [Wenzhouxiangella sp. XN201]NEZ04413.1 shikimate dehydrogenase [Wenzhouxiangella sp. XN201]
MSTPRFKLAVFGQPVAHSLSPRIHRLFGEQLGIDVDFSAIEAGVDELPDRLEAFRTGGGTGANLTVPLKSAGLKLCTRVDRAARRAHAVNTLKRETDGWHGFNTDGAGLIRDFDRLGIDPAGRRVLIVGAGGAVAGILGPLLERRPERVHLINRTAERAHRLADKFAHLGCIHGDGFESDPGSQFDLLIQSTSAGHAGMLPAIRRDWLDNDVDAYDLNYGAAHQDFARWCREHRLTCHDGLGMLVGQAALAFEIWTGQTPATDAVVEQLRSG